MDPGITAALAVGMANYAGYIVYLSPAGIKIVAIGAIFMLAGANIAGIRSGAGLMRWLTLAKLGSLAFIAIWGLGLHLANWGNFLPFAGRQAGFGAAAGGPGRRHDGSIFLVRRMVGRKQDCRGGPRSRTHPTSGADFGGFSGDRGLHSGDRRFSLSRPGRARYFG